MFVEKKIIIKRGRRKQNKTEQSIGTQKREKVSSKNETYLIIIEHTFRINLPSLANAKKLKIH